MSASLDLNFGVSEFVAVFNQTVEYAYPSVLVTGELANLRVSRGKFVYFDIKDSAASLRCFAMVYQMPGPLEDGMMVTLRAQPRLHPLYNFSLNVQAVQVSGEGSLRRAADLLAAKLQAEGLFAAERKRSLPYPPSRIGLITSIESAAYADFIKILSARWQGIEIDVIDTQVQGEAAPAQIIKAIERFNSAASQPDVLVITRGGGSADDLAAFNTEPVVRAVAASRIPTLVAIGHEIDISLAEMAADQRASTPSNAAELLVPDKLEAIKALAAQLKAMQQAIVNKLDIMATSLEAWQNQALGELERSWKRSDDRLVLASQLLVAFNPQQILLRGYALVRQGGNIVRQAAKLTDGPTEVEFADGRIGVIINSYDKK